METVKLIIDRKPVEVPKGTTILDAAKGMGIRIPTLCYMKLEICTMKIIRVLAVSA